jgi:hypothetical protein
MNAHKQWIRGAAGLVVAAWLTTSVAAQTCPSVSSTWPVGPLGPFAASGSHVFLGCGAMLIVSDASDPGNPVEEGSLWLPVTPSVIEAEGNRLYAAGGSSLLVYDITDTEHPELLGRYDGPSTFTLGAVSASKAYIASGNTISILDVSTPSLPTLRGSLSLPGHADVVAVQGALLCAHQWDETSNTITTVDISDADHPHALGALGIHGMSRLVLSGRWGYLAGGDAFYVLDLQNPAQPLVAGTLALAGGSDLVVREPFAYLAGGQALTILDVSNQQAPVQLDFLRLTRSILHLRSAGDALAASTELGLGLRMIDLANPASPSEAGSLRTPDEVRTAAATGNLGLLGGLNGYLTILDLSDASRPISLYQGAMPELATARKIAVSGGLAYVAQEWAGLRIMDISDPVHPLPRGQSSSPHFATDVAVNGSVAYVADNSYGLRCYNVRDPDNPSEIGGLQAPILSELALSGNTAYLATGNPLSTSFKGLQIVDVTNPAHPRVLGQAATTDGGVAVLSKGPYVYFAGAFSLYVVDVSSPTAPRVAASLPFEHVTDLSLAGTLLLLATQTDLFVLDVSRPTAPQERGRLAASVGSLLWSVTSADRVAIASLRGAGAQILDLASCLYPEVSAVAKKTNPFGLTVSGRSFQPGLTVDIEGTPWTTFTLAGPSKLVLKGGASLKALFPRGTWVRVSITNPGGTSVAFEYDLGSDAWRPAQATS